VATEVGTGGNSRAHLLLRLVGGDHEDGEVPLDRLARIAEHTQALVVRLARVRRGREGTGRTPASVTAATRLVLVNIGRGSTLLDIAGPSLERELDFGEGVTTNLTVEVVQLLQDALTAVALDDAPLPPMSDPAMESLDDWLHALAPYEEVEASVSDGRGDGKELKLRPVTALTTLRRKVGGGEDGRKEVRREVEGELYSVDLHSGRFRVEDDLGHSIALVVRPGIVGDVAALLGRRVRASGQATTELSGAIRSLAVDDLALAGDVAGFDSSEYWSEEDFEEQLARRPPLASVDAFTMSELSEAESDAFWAAIEEGRG
jgi:hypothetical protein